jgi:hypothetical protein
VTPVAGESFAGITVPEGEPGAVREAAGIFTGAAGGLQAVTSGLQAIPEGLSDWRGPASASFRGATITNGAALDAGVEAMRDAARAANDYADALEEAQREARAAVRAARDAQQRIDQAESDIAAAQSAQVAASERLERAYQQAALAGMHGAPDTGAMAAASAASDEIATAEAQETRARAELERAQDDLLQAKRRGEDAEDAARLAARRAGSIFSGLSGATPAAAVLGGSPALLGARTIGRLRAGDYSALDDVPLNYLSEDDQRTIAAIVAGDVREAQYGEGDESISELSDFVERYQYDDEFATGFYNELGGAEASQLMFNVGNFAHEGEGWDDPGLVALMAPFSTTLGTATRSRELRRDFTDDFIGTDLPIADRIPGHEQLEAFLRTGEAANYDGHFLARMGEELMIEPQVDPEAPPHQELSERQDFMEFMAGNEEASGLLLAGSDSNGQANVATLMLYGPRYTDDGQGLAALVGAGTHDLRSSGTDNALASAAAHRVIQATPSFAEHLPERVGEPLVTILDDHIADFEYVATDRAVPGAVDGRPEDGISTLTYEEGHEYLKALFAEDHTRAGASDALGSRVGESMFRAADEGDMSYATRAGALAEMGVMGARDADLDAAAAADAADGLKQAAAGKLFGLTPGSKVPLMDEIAGAAFADVFPADHLQRELTEQLDVQIDQMQAVKRLSIAAQVDLGHLPPQALDMIAPDGTVNVDVQPGPGGDQDVLVDERTGRPLSWDLNQDNQISAEEREVTEREVYEAGLGPAEAAHDGMQSLADVEHARLNPPSIDDLPVPDGYSNDNPNWLEDLGSWPFDAPGENTISDADGNVVAHQDDLHWDPDEHVYRLEVERPDGSTTEITYLEIGSDWQVAEKRDGQWVPVD